MSAEAVKRREEEQVQTRMNYFSHANVLAAAMPPMSVAKPDRELATTAAALLYCYEKAGRPKKLEEEIKQAQEIRKAYGETRFDELRATIADVKESRPESVSILLKNGGTALVPPQVSAEKPEREARSPAPQASLQADQTRERNFLESKTDSLPPQIDKAADIVLDRVYTQEVAAIAAADSIAEKQPEQASRMTNEAMVSAAYKKLEWHYAVEDYKQGRTEPLEKVLKEGGVKLERIGGRIQVTTPKKISEPIRLTKQETDMFMARLESQLAKPASLPPEDKRELEKLKTTIIGEKK